MTVYQPAIDFEPEPETKLKPGILHDGRDHMLMWFDDSKLPLQEKIQRAASYYYQKYDRKPNLVEVHTNTPPPTDWMVLAAMGIIIRFNNNVLINHLFIGQEEGANVLG